VLEVVWKQHVELANLLDAACEDDPKKAWPAMDALRSAAAPKIHATPLLLATAAPGTTRTPAGLVPRRVRALVSWAREARARGAPRSSARSTTSTTTAGSASPR
jgi:hypothetical protein